MNIFTLPQSAGGVLLGVAILLTAGFLMTRLTRRLHLPNVTGYILAGILVGPYALNLIPAWLSGGMEFVTDLALSYIAFSAGRYFRIADLKRSGGKVLAVTLAEALCAAVAVTLTMIFVFRLSVPFALLLGAIGCATAPASTIMTIRQYRAKGPFVNLLLQVTALDDAVALTAFSVCTAVVNALQTALYSLQTWRCPCCGIWGRWRWGWRWPCCCVGLPGRGIPRHTHWYSSTRCFCF